MVAARTPRTVFVSELQEGDFVIPAGATVTNVDKLGPLFIVDFDDKTSTPPIPNALVEILR